MEKRSIGLAAKMVVGMIAVATITYGTSAFFIFVLGPLFFSFIPSGLFNSLTLLLGVIWSGILGYCFARYLTIALKDIEGKMAEAAGGNLSIAVNPRPTRDELESLGVGLRTMIDRLKKIVKGIQRHSSNTAVQMNRLNRSSSEMSRQADQVSLSLHQISEGAEAEAGSSTRVLENVQEALQLAESITGRAGSCKDSAARMVAELEKSATYISRLIEGTHRVGESNVRMSEELAALVDQAHGIGEIAGKVSDIAEQTQMLSFNARIESARAGDAGRGFIVVAENVQKLAEESAEAVVRIRTAIQEVQRKVTDTLKQFDEQLGLGKMQAARAEDTDRALSVMSRAVYAVSESISAIVEQTEKQQGKMRIIAEEAEKTAGISQETSASVREVSHGARMQAEQMVQIMQYIRSLYRETEMLATEVHELKV